MDMTKPVITSRHMSSDFWFGWSIYDFEQAQLEQHAGKKKQGTGCLIPNLL